MNATNERALVLGGGGSTGNAWLIGVVAGLFEAGLDVTDADLVVGTSAGSTAAAQITGASLSDLLADILSAEHQRRTSAVPPGASRATAASVVEHLARMDALIAASTGPQDARRRMAAATMELDAASPAATHARWRDTVAARLPSQQWPERDVLITAVDARSGDPVVLDRHSGVGLADAVAASCASGRPHAVGDERYIDGGFRRNENADLAAGYARVLVLSPFGGRSRHPLEWGTHLAAQVEELRAAGSRVETIVPGGESEHLFGANAMNVVLRPDAARAGHEQGKTLAARLSAFWR
ncbi:Patatin [Xylanimonas cellulosilytica DSM 15894]|uniref:Patatin n=1 Tax=Xylanimonas cellulosilytica (strain DSM 15894 / JCM 12276 / CECT 5975 / KCTC 9989 / LMG 20990 / NBRC 107835 / XIL07) TaxID=446471 RepID=D1BT47_XYLCX|nr:patatin-like phospholipase family protein [Xylanimonas cellulosilytica]ACZ30889.1 Patatin [Xylanimonas cellulosilytica DSM 15894]